MTQLPRLGPLQNRVKSKVSWNKERRITRTEMTVILGENGLPLLGEDERPMTKQVKIHLQHLLPKGAKTDEERQQFTLLSAFFAKRPGKSLFSVVSSSFSVSFLPKQASFIKMAGEPPSEQVLPSNVDLAHFW
jgi:hypothetical protein